MGSLHRPEDIWRFWVAVPAAGDLKQAVAILNTPSGCIHERDLLL